MEILYKNKKIEALCTNDKKAVKTLGSLVAEKLTAALEVLEAVDNLREILSLPQYRLHKLFGDRKNTWAMDLGRKLGFRLIIIPLNINYEELIISDDLMLVEAVCVEIEEVTNHYE